MRAHVSPAACKQPVANLLQCVASNDDDDDDGEDEEGDWDDDVVETVVGRPDVRRVTHADNVETCSRLKILPRGDENIYNGKQASNLLATSACVLVVGQIMGQVVQIVIHAPILARMFFGGYWSNLHDGPLKNPRWRPFFSRWPPFSLYKLKKN